MEACVFIDVDNLTGDLIVEIIKTTRRQFDTLVYRFTLVPQQQERLGVSSTIRAHHLARSVIRTIIMGRLLATGTKLQM